MTLVERNATMTSETVNFLVPSLRLTSQYPFQQRHWWIFRNA